jgi:hypothetical protein
MAGIVYTKLIDALKGIGVDVSQQQGSNVKKLAPKNKSTATKPGLLASERDTGGNFATVLDIFKNEAKYIDSMNDAEQMAFLNNIIDYNEFGGKSIRTSEGIRLLDESKKLTDDVKDMQTSIEDILKTAKTMKDEAEAGKKKALQDLDDFFETGGQPLKKKDDKFLGGSMHEEGQLRTGIRQFLQTEYKNGRIKLDDLDKARVMEYSPMIEHDPILVFKKIYGDEAYNKAGSFPGAFEIGENFKHYEEIFRNNMGEDILKVKDKKYVGDGKLVLTKQEEVFEPTPDDDDIPFAKGGRASFAGGKLVSEFIALIVKKEPIEAMKEVNKVIGKKGKYKNLTQKDIDKIVADTEDHIFQRDPDNLYVYDDGKTVFDDDLTKEQLIEKEGRKLDQENISGSADDINVYSNQYIKKLDQEIIDSGLYTKKEWANLSEDLKEARRKSFDSNYADAQEGMVSTADDMSVEDSLTTLEGLGATKMAERFKLKQKYPGISDDLLTNIIEDTDPVHKASVLAKIDMAMELTKRGKNVDETIQILESEPKTKMATGGRAGFYLGGQSGQSVIEPDLSDIGHGSDALMSRTRMLGPNAQATTSTGLNYLLGEDNDNTRVPFNDGLLVPKPKPYVEKPYTTEMFEDDSMTLLKGMYGTGKDSNEFLYNEMIKKGNMLRKQGVERETIIEIIRNNKDKINAFLETQTTTPKSFEGMADGGIADLRQGYNKGSIVDKGRRGFLQLLGGTVAGVAALKAGLVKILGKDSGAISKKVIDEVIIDGGTGAPAWLQPLVNKALREGTDKTKNLAYKDAQEVKRLDTPTGQVDVYYDVRTGEVEIDYIGGNTALGESVNMRYTPGIADEGTKGKPADEFSATESIPEGRMTGPDDYNIEMGENTVDEVGGLYSDTSELAELGGQKPIIKDIVETVKKKKVLKKMESDPAAFANENLPPYDY